MSETIDPKDWKDIATILLGSAEDPPGVPNENPTLWDVENTYEEGALELG